MISRSMQCIILKTQDEKMAKCVVFGATGFIGCHLVNRLLAEKNEVTVFTRSSSNPFDATNPYLKFFIGDFMNQADIDAAIAGMDYVFHLVSLTNPATSDADPFIDIETNVKMTICLLNSCVKHAVKRVIYTSSGGSVYGETINELSNELDCIHPVSPYAIGKSTIEYYLQYYYIKHAQDYVVLRVANVYGEGQSEVGGKHGIVAVFASAILAGRQLKIYGDGSMTRDYIYVSDVADLMSRVFNKPSLKYRLYNVGSGVGHTILEVIGTIERELKRKSELTFVKAPDSFVHKIVLDCNRSINEFGDYRSISFENGIKKACDYYVQKLKPKP